MLRKIQIGEFSRMTGIPVKTLRFYADEKLLGPDYIEPRTGYRYYSTDQIREATKVMNLRLAGLRLDEIRGLIQTPITETQNETVQLVEVLDRQNQILGRELSKIKIQLNAIDILKQGLKSLGPAVLTDLKFQIVEPDLAFVKHLTHGSGGPSITELFEDAERAVAAVHARSDKSPYSIHFGDTQAPYKAAVCIPIRDDCLSKINGTSIGETSLVVSASFAGSYTKTDRTRAKIVKFLKQLKLTPKTEERIIYHRFGADQVSYKLPRHMLAASNADFKTEVQIPIDL